MNKTDNTIKWKKAPEKHDYPACYDYLCLLYTEEEAKKIIKKLKKAPVITKKAKDIFRASRLSLLGNNNSHVVKNLEKIDAGEKLSPLLLVRPGNAQPVIIGDGYHRLCSVYARTEDADIPLQIVTK